MLYWNHIGDYVHPKLIDNKEIGTGLEWLESQSNANRWQTLLMLNEKIYEGYNQKPISEKVKWSPLLYLQHSLTSRSVPGKTSKIYHSVHRSTLSPVVGHGGHRDLHGLPWGCSWACKSLRGCPRSQWDALILRT